MASLRADRRLYVNADRSLIVEEGDPRGSWLLVAEGLVIGEGDVALYNLSVRNGKVVWPALLKQAEPAENKQAPKLANKAAKPPADDADGDDDGEAANSPPKPLRSLKGRRQAKKR